MTHTNTAQHTEGPWAISRHGTPDYAPQYGIYAEGGGPDLAIVTGPNSPANARLIALAPEMAEALRDAEAALDYREHRDNEELTRHGHNTMPASRTLSTIRAILARLQP
jgi:hypothetical protein